MKLEEKKVREKRAKRIKKSYKRKIGNRMKSQKKNKDEKRKWADMKKWKMLKQEEKENRWTWRKVNTSSKRGGKKRNSDKKIIGKEF